MQPSGWNRKKSHGPLSCEAANESWKKSLVFDSMLHVSVLWREPTQMAMSLFVYSCMTFFFLLAATAPLCSEEPSPQAIAVSGVPEKELELSLKHNGISKNLSRSLIPFLGFSSV